MKLLRVFISFLSVFCVSQGFCHEKQDNSFSEKIYLHPGQISLLPDGIFIWLDNQQIPVDAIYADSDGLYTSAAVIPFVTQESAIGRVQSAKNRSPQSGLY